MVMTPEQITAELQRKKNAGILPTSQTNNAQYNKLAPTTPTTPQPNAPTFSAYGGKDNYAAGQNDRWQQANQNNDQDLMSRLMDDSKRAGYTLNPYAANANNNPYTSNANNNSNTSSNDLLGRLNEVMNKQTMKELPQFNYDPNSDPQYQAALNRAKSNSETASGNAMAELNKRGILNSTITGDRLGQIEQSEYGRVSDTILPQLMEQAYGRHRDTVGDQYRAGRDEISDLANLLGMTSDLDQRGLDNAFRDKSFNRGVLESDRGFNRGVLESDRGFNRGVVESDRGFNRGVLESDRSYEYTQGRDKVTDKRWQTEFDRVLKQDGIQNALAWAQNSISKQNANTSSASQSNAASNANFSKLMDVWSATGKAPDGLQNWGISPGSEYKPNSSSPANKPVPYTQNPGFASDVNDIISGKRTLDDLKNNAQAFIEAYGYDGYLALEKAAEDNMPAR